jgi:hypothetical protein
LNLTQDTGIFKIVNGGADVGPSVHYTGAQSGTEGFTATEWMDSAQSTQHVRQAGQLGVRQLRMVAGSDWQVQVLRLEETLLLVMHVVRELLKPGDSIWLGSENRSGG